MDKLSFLWYYVGLVTRVALGSHHTMHPITLRWRWRLWRSYRGRIR
ncbi:MAG: hypothetical protein ACJ73D_00010 [Pyrinomonadaceae bacterium]